MRVVHTGSMSRRGIALLAVSASVLLGATGLTNSASAAPAPASSTAAPASGNVIVLLRNQHTNLAIRKGSARSARIVANRSSQSPVIRHARSLGASRIRGFDSINAVAAHVTKAQASALTADPSVAAVVPDRAIKAPPSLTEAARRRAASPKVRTGPVCPTNPAKPLLEPEALQLTHDAYRNEARPQATKIVDGTGVKVAFMADGIDIDNPDFIRADGSHVFVDYQDFSGEGPDAPSSAAEAFGDASSIAAQGRETYDIADYVNTAHPVTTGCTIQIRGMAPGASLIGLKVFGNAPSAPTSRFIEAIDYAVTDGADVLNQSFGANPFPDTNDDPITLADNAAIAAGVTVVASTGDSGVTGTIGSPASSPDGVIGVAATTSFRSYLQETYGGSQLSNGTWISNNISGLSSGGVTQAGGVPDLAAPGDLGWAVCTPNIKIYIDCTDDNGDPSPIQDFGGTSQSSPLTAGAAALVIEAYEKSHRGARPSPALVKRFLTSTATDLGHPAYEQGAGLLNALGAVQAAQSWQDANATPARSGNNLVVDKTQLRLHGRPGADAVGRVKVTNDGRTTQFVRASTRSFEDVVSSVDGTTSLDTATAPAYIDPIGISRSYVKQTFHVGRTDRLSVAVTGATAPGALRVILIDPSGAYAAYSIPQGAANYAYADVRFPAPGTWTAYFAVPTAATFAGTLTYRVTQTDFSRHGRVYPSYRVLRPGQTGSFTVVAPLPTSPSDLSASVQFTPFSGGPVSVPMTLRAIVPPRDSTFTGTITGGNGRQDNAQSNFYWLRVPAGRRDLAVSLRLQDPNQRVLALLTAPDGQVYSFQSNVSADGKSTLPAIQIYRRDPQPGLWSLDLDITTPASGQFVSSSFIANVAYDTVEIRGNLPRGGRLAAGVPVTVPVRVHNTGATTMTYYADARLHALGQISLAELSGEKQPFPLPQPAGFYPFWLVPTETGLLTVSAAADQPVNLDIFYSSGNPERYAAAAGNGATVNVAARMVSPGIWAADVGQTGPFAAPAPAGTFTTTATSTGRLFDTAVTADGGDPWEAGVLDQAALANAAAVHPIPVGSGRSGAATAAAAAPAVSDTPLTLRPGQSGVLNVTITPSGPRGSVVRGDVFIDSFDAYTGSGDELVDLPYRYRIG